MTTRHRRDFLLDSGAVTALATDPNLLDGYVDLMQHRLRGSILIPVPVLTEVRVKDYRNSPELLIRIPHLVV